PPHQPPSPPHQPPRQSGWTRRVTPPPARLAPRLGRPLRWLRWTQGLLRRERPWTHATPVTSASPPLAQPSEPASSSSSTRRRRRRRVDSAVFAS
ncbi:hypothetical protein EMIHUDRAFT_368999, partial [Emiliania huxleyi CCMP1516]|uniref:Uncharacterized protein n=2 Tax=Emiliania huxleyi TaxID=2903 RepID=A0A0D3JBD4_EMIH1